MRSARVETSSRPAAAQTGPGQLEITDRAAVEGRVREARPEAVVHLAGVSSVARSHDHPSATIAVNVLGVTHLLEAVRKHAPRARILLVGSGEVYGAVARNSRASEDNPVLPLSPYAASKLPRRCWAVRWLRLTD
jgi:GDP-4-dehydro-6-deoxy-D-mannose reductase